MRSAWVTPGSMTAMERVADEAGGDLWFQLYLWPDRSMSHELVERAKAAGYKALVVTVDGVSRTTNPAALTPNIIVQRAPQTAALLRDLANWFGAFRIDPPIDHGSVNRAVAFVEMRSEFFVQVIKPCSPYALLRQPADRCKFPNHCLVAE